MGSANVFMSKICVWWMKKMAFLWFLIHLKWIIEVSWKKCGYWGKEFSNYTIWGFIFVNTFKLWPFFCIPVSLMELGVLIEDTSCLQRPQHQSHEQNIKVLRVQSGCKHFMNTLLQYVLYIDLPQMVKKWMGSYNKFPINYCVQVFIFCTCIRMLFLISNANPF